MNSKNLRPIFENYLTSKTPRPLRRFLFIFGPLWMVSDERLLLIDIEQAEINSILHIGLRWDKIDIR